MGLIDPVYSPEELEGLTEQKLKRLRAAVLKELREDPDVRALLKKKTRPVYLKLIRKRRKRKG
jgi:hypothetical protein